MILTASPNGRRRWLATTLLAGAAGLPAASALAQTALPPVPVEVEAASEPSLLTTTTLTEAELDAKRDGGNDTANLLKGIPGLSLTSGGGVSSLPSIHGMADDRLNITLDGMPLAAACPNHMNPVLSYVDPTRVSKITVMAGLTPVSAGGDSIGGTIAVETAPPAFAAPGEDLRTDLELSAFYRSSAHAVTTAGHAAMATDSYSIGYDGAYAHAGDYHRGGDNQPVRTSTYETTEHALSLAAKSDAHLLQLQAGVQYMPYQGFPNQRMDLTDNRSKFANGRWQGSFDWGTAEARLYWHDVSHQMNFLGKVKGSDMPMNTTATSYGYGVKAELPGSARDTWRVGNEFHRFLLDDWWPPVAGMMSMMAPNDFQNIHGGERNRVGTFAEWEARWTPQWTTLLGVRNDTVWTDTGNVQGYNTSYDTEAAAFNAQDHLRTDVNFDLTALVRYRHDDSATYEGGYARKTRSPSLYERYSWSSEAMAASMNNWTGDGNSYVGNIDLSPEVAHTLSVSGDWHDPAGKAWKLKVTPYYTYVQDYIDADRYNTVTTANSFVKLKLFNHEAQIYGADIAGEVEAWDVAGAWGRGVVKASLAWANGENLDTGDNLYNIMPLTFRLALEHQSGGWRNAVEMEGADNKGAVSHTRNEVRTPGYAIFNLRSAYAWENVTVSVGIENLFNQLYHLPLGGADLSDTGKQWGTGLYGTGRSYLAGLSVKF